MLIAMAIWDTPENGRHVCTAQTLDSLHCRVDLVRHRLVLVDNGSTCPRTLDRLAVEKTHGATVITLPKNIGTARAINAAWVLRSPGENAVKMDNDVVVHYNDWPDLMEEVFRRAPGIGICGLKRNDLEERPDHENEWYRSQLVMLRHTPQERWIVVEAVHHVMGTCQAYRSELLDKIGFLDQGHLLYGLDDAMASARAHIAGFSTVFVPHVPIDHVDNCQKDYTDWKQKHVQGAFDAYNAAVRSMAEGKTPLYCPPEGRDWTT